MALGAVEGGVNNLLAQVLPEAFNQVQVGRIGGQKHLINRLIGQPGPQFLVFVYSSRIALRIEGVKFEPHTGCEFLAKLGESVKEIEDGRFKLALGSVKGGVDDFLAQKLPAAFNQVQVG